MLLRKRGGRLAVLQSKAWAEARKMIGADEEARAQGWQKKMIGGIPHYWGRQAANDVARSLVEAGSRSAGRRREGAAAGQSGRALRAGPVRDQEGRSKLGSLTMESPAVQIPRAARWPSWSLEEARWSSAGAAAAGQSRRHKSCELACCSRRERACVARREDPDTRSPQSHAPRCCDY